MDLYADALASLNRHRVSYVVVGVFGVNLYAERAGMVILTQDCDLLLRAESRILARALRVLRKRGWEMTAGGEPFLGEHPDDLTSILRGRTMIRALRRGRQIDLALGLAGLDFEAVWKNRRVFRTQGVRVPVAPLADLLRSKELANRPKDRVFLETYRAALEELGRST